MNRFAFGANWAAFARELQPDQVAEAERSLRNLLGREKLDGLRFLDIGSGSGLFSLVASKMGAAVTSFDFDEDSVRTTESVLAHSPRDDWRVMRGSILDRSFISTLGTFDVVYAWGVLHHTGDMWAALDNAAALVRPTGTLVVSLYRKTPLCAVWRAEKRLYAGALPSLQTTIRTLYKAAFVAALAVRGRNPITYARDYKRNRGMEWSADVHDWLGGYPQESTSAAKVRERLAALGFRALKSNERPTGFGLFGTGCDEFVATRYQ